MKGYKVFNFDWTCLGFQYKVGETYEMNQNPICCKQGFHFCTKLSDCFSYYDFDLDNKVAEVEALGDIDTERNDSKACTNKIKIIRELTWKEVYSLVNMGEDNKGIGNTGDCNNGKCNAGSKNLGSHNSGQANDGDFNSGDFNEGGFNSGDNNKGSGNSGNYNIGSYNTGCRNSGHCNTGKYNKGDYNAGRHNVGNCNIGDCNKTNFSTGCFNTEEPKIRMFNKPSEWTFRDWEKSGAYYLLDKLNLIKSNWAEYNIEKAGQYWWDRLNPIEKDEFRKLPNFDKEIFAEIMEIDINTI